MGGNDNSCEFAAANAVNIMGLCAIKECYLSVRVSKCVFGRCGELRGE